jgi:dihydrofolate reductase
MRPLRYTINVTLDGCCDHRAFMPSTELLRHAVANMGRADVLLLGRVIYEMMEAAWRDKVPSLGVWTGAGPDPTVEFSEKINGMKKYVLSSTLKQVDWNAELLRGELPAVVQQLKDAPGKGVMVWGVELPRALAALGLIDEYEFVVHPVLAGHGPTLFAGLPKRIELTSVGRKEFEPGVVATRYAPKRS